ncbi:DUF1028 domain-containing protein [Phycisphaerales bacterium AB-hyl4]|uniref:DUF1028 domain-containing protein n=1 Tax=Natronomicrosphaera hydrolytica TaxID=3242702 RepID=A0ABV4U281_9BACT
MTFSIVARCPRTKQVGIAAVTAVPAVGKLLTWAYPRTGAIATQAWINPYLGHDGITKLREGLDAKQALDAVVLQDPDRDIRQVGIVDGQGNVAGWTGSKTSKWAGHITGPGYCVQGNLLVGHEPLHAMRDAFEADDGAPLAERLLTAIEAGEATGGDRRGANSATVYVIDTEVYPLWDLRVDDHKHPLKEVRRLYHVFEELVVPHIVRLPKRDDPHGQPEPQALA